jgi:hypothetical protein
LSSGQCLAQELANKIENITLTIGNARRIPYHIVKIKIKNRENIIQVNVSSRPKNDDLKWQYSKIDTTFSIDHNTFKDIVDKLSDLSKIDLYRAMTKGGIESTNFILEFGTWGVNISYKFSEPDNLTELRSLNDFLLICEKIIKVGGLNSKDLF